LALPANRDYLLFNSNAVKNPTGGLGVFILRCSDFVNWVKETLLADRSEKREIPQLMKLKPKLLPDQVVAAVCDEFDCNTDLILQKGRKINAD
jgi:hypothetical protein